MSFETDSWPMIRARWFTPVEGVRRKVRVVVIHSMEFPEQPDAARIIAHDFANRPADQKASAHLCIDDRHIIQCVRDNDVAFAAPGCNNDGIQIELAGFARQTQGEWLDAYGRRLLELAADATAQYCRKYGLPAVHLTNEQLRAGKKGIVGHRQVSEVYRKSDHMDPGTGFPWEFFLERVHFHSVKLQG
jgi:N-acetyl-anhydromuramyl-L-alanine amidase AmpD